MSSAPTSGTTQVTARTPETNAKKTQDDARRVFSMTPPRGDQVFVIADQGIVSAGAFGTGIVLARSLSRGDFGLYALLASVVYVCIVFFSTTFTYPLAGVLNSGQHANQLFSRGLLVFGFYVSAITGCAAGGILGLGNGLTLGSIGCVAFLFWFCQDVTRRALILSGRSRDAMVGDAISYLGQAAMLFGMTVRQRSITLPMVLVVVSVTSLVGLGIQCIQLNCLPYLTIGEHRKLLSSLAPSLKWGVLSSSFNTLTTQGLMWAVSFGHSAAGAASLQAVTSPLGITHPLLFGVSGVVVPEYLRAVKTTDDFTAVTRAFRHSVPLLAAMTLICLLVACWPATVLAVFYGSNSSYAHLGTALRLNAAVYLLNFMAGCPYAVMHASATPQFGTWTQAVGSVVFVLLVIPIAVLGELDAALLAMTAVVGARLLFCGWWVYSLKRSRIDA